MFIDIYDAFIIKLNMHFFSINQNTFKFKTNKKTRRCFRKRKQSCLHRLSLDGIKYVLEESEIVN